MCERGAAQGSMLDLSSAAASAGAAALAQLPAGEHAPAVAVPAGEVDIAGRHRSWPSREGDTTLHWQRAGEREKQERTRGGGWYQQHLRFPNRSSVTHFSSVCQLVCQRVSQISNFVRSSRPFPSLSPRPPAVVAP